MAEKVRRHKGESMIAIVQEGIFFTLETVISKFLEKIEKQKQEDFENLIQDACLPVFIRSAYQNAGADH